MEDWGFPIFYIKKDIEKIMKCYNDYNSNGRNKKNDRSLCAMECHHSCLLLLILLRVYGGVKWSQILIQ
ncbi:hypothetical protein R5R35_013954 [Gryllus longicercus]|uniref:Nicastrin small lobe domain-containing protein n=1 Tax=Gryllus longicercus TaxID=2509291 RepID=A0AAN9V4T6_9ORTH